MTIMIIGLILFFAIHAVPMRPVLRSALIERMGEMPYKGAFSLVAILGFVLIVHGYGAARAFGPIVLYWPPLWLSHVTLLLMVPVFVLLVAAYAPTGHIRARVKHPMVLAVKLWAVSHLLANGDLPSVILFGGFLAWGIVDRISLKRRGDLGGGAVERLSPRGDIIAIVGGLAAYVVFAFYLHTLLIGVPVVTVG